MPSTSRYLLASFALVASLGCSSETTAPAHLVASVWPAQVSLGVGAMRVLDLRDSAQHSVSPVEWTVDDTSIAQLYGGGVLGRRAGTTTVRGTHGGQEFTATLVVEPLRFASVSAGMQHACGLTADGLAYCWGLNQSGEVGDGTHLTRTRPSQVATDLRFTAIATGLSEESCGVTGAGEVWCWGFLVPTTGAPATDAATPTRVEGLPALTSLHIGYMTACGIDAAGAIWCWGLTREWQLGHPPGSCGYTSCYGHPEKIALTGTFSDVSVGGDYVCGLASSGDSWCWGTNYFGAFGNGSWGQVSPPTAAGSGKAFTSISASGYHTCGLDVSGAAWCWGDNSSGELGAASSDNCTSNGTMPCSLAPLLVGGNHHFSKLYAGDPRLAVSGLSCGLEDGTAWCWGSNFLGALGNGGGPDSPVPTAVAGNLAFRMLAVGDFTCGITTDGVAYCWGPNDDGELGNGTMTNSNVPVPVGSTTP